MKAKLLTLTVALISFSFAYAQNVGIGQNNPKSKLDVNGNLIVGSSYSGTATTAPANGAIIQGPVGIGTVSPNSNAILDLSGTPSLGLLLPQVSTSGESSITPSSSLNGLLFYNSTTNCIDIVSNSVWQSIFCPCPVISPTITGTSPVCPSSTTNTFTVTNTTGASSYTWALSSGASFTTGTSTTGNTITVTSPSSGNFSVSCTATNACGTGYVAPSKTVTLVTAPSTAAITTTLSGVCQGTTSSTSLVGNSGTISSGSGVWSVTNGPSGYTGHMTFGTPTATTTTVIADATAPVGAYTVTWTITNTPCTQTSSTTTTVNVAGPPSTAVISSGGGQSLCPGRTALSNLVGNSIA